jgi:glycosyltransferase involved in cell wall biosynthesis
MIICVTKALGNQINKFIPENIKPKVKVLYLGAKNVKEFAEYELKAYKEELNTENSFIVGFVGRINEAKGQYLLIEALKRLKVKNLDIKVYFVGHAMNEEYLNSLKQKVKSYNLEKEVNFLGFVNEPSKFMQICDVIVAASKNETFGLVVIEAMKNQTAIIASNSGGFLEIIDNRINGLLFENENIEDLALKIEELYNDKDLKDNLVLEAKKKVDLEFDSEIQFEKLKEIFKGV